MKKNSKIEREAVSKRWFYTMIFVIPLCGMCFVYFLFFQKATPQAALYYAALAGLALGLISLIYNLHPNDNLDRARRLASQRSDDVFVHAFKVGIGACFVSLLLATIYAFLLTAALDGSLEPSKRLGTAKLLLLLIFLPQMFALLIPPAIGFNRLMMDSYRKL